MIISNNEIKNMSDNEKILEPIVISNLYRTNKIKIENSELFKHIFIKLIKLWETSFFGKKFYKVKEDIYGHFEWALNKIIEELYNSSIILNIKTKLKEYLYEFYYNNFHTNDTHSSFDKMFIDIYYITNFFGNKTASQLNEYIKLYHLFNSSIVYIK
jgi:hypothetical protein